MNLTNAVAQGDLVPTDLVAGLEEHRALLDQGIELADRIAQSGYLYFPRFLDRDDVLAARTEIFEKLAKVGEIEGPAEQGIYSGTSQRRDAIDDLGAFWRSVAETWALRRLTHGPDLLHLMARIFGAPARAQDFIFLRPANRGKFTGIHCDYPFFTRETEQVLTAWIALGDIPVAEGPLFIVENSHRFEDILAEQRGFDVVRDTSRTAAFTVPPVEFARERKTRLLTANYEAGDVVVFPMFTLHGSLDNVSPSNRIRLSVDVRYQPAAQPRDPRYFGPDPGGTTGAGYGELTGAKPLNEAWHVR